MNEKELKEWKLDESLRAHETYERGEITRFDLSRRLEEIGRAVD